MTLGSSPYENGQLLITPQEKKILTTKYPESNKLFKKFVGSAEFLKGIEKYCLWIKDEDLPEAYKIPEIKQRLNNIRDFREKS